jgi:hypothetical protein
MSFRQDIPWLVPTHLKCVEDTEMQNRRQKITLNLSALALSTCLMLGVARAQTGTVLYTFTGTDDGGVPYAGLVMDKAGNLYGTASQYGDGPCTFPVSGCGMVFELTPTKAGWNLKILYTFQGGEDGANPYSSLVFDSSGNLYGTTAWGGIGCGGYGCGTVFELTRSEGWHETVLYRFTGEADGNGPVGPVTLDGAGNIYGTTPFGGDYTCAYDGSASCGVVFRLERPSDSSGSWRETVLHTFEGADGSQPFDGVTLAPALPYLNSSVGPPETLYGTTLFGGEGDSIDSGGVVFRLVPSGGSWIYQTVYEFSPGDGRPGGRWSSTSREISTAWRDRAANTALGPSMKYKRHSLETTSGRKPISITFRDRTA